MLEGEFYWQHTDGEQRGLDVAGVQAGPRRRDDAELLVYCAMWLMSGSGPEVPNLMAYVEAPGPALPPKPPPVPRMLAVPCKRAGTEPEPSSEFEAWDGDPDSVVAAARRLSPAGAVCRGPLRSLRSDRQHAGARRGVGARAPGARRGPVRPRCPVPSTPSRRVDGVWATNAPSHRFTTQGAGDEAQVQEARRPGRRRGRDLQDRHHGCRLRQLQVRQAQGRPYWAGPQVPALLDRGGGEMS